MKSRISEKHADIDWKKLSSIDIYNLFDQISDNSALLNELSQTIAFCSLNEEFDTNTIDPNFIKLFRISQIIINYLLKEYNRLNSGETNAKNPTNLVQENKKLRKLLEIHQKAMTYNGVLNNDYMQCPHCPKAFYDVTFLKTHIVRRHPNESLASEGMLSLTRKIQDYQSFLIGDNKNIEEMRSGIQILSEKLEKTELDLLLEKESRMKLEDKIESEVVLCVNQIKESLIEKIEDLRNERETQIIEHSVSTPNNENVESSDSDSDDNDNIQLIQTDHTVSNDHSWKSNLEQIIVKQTNEMLKIGSSVEKLVSHLTDKLSRNKVSDNHFRSVNTHSIPVKGNFKTLLKVSDNEEKFQPIKSFKTEYKESFDWKASEIIESKLNMKTQLSRNEIRKEIENSLLEKLNSYGIQSDVNGISGELYEQAIEKANADKRFVINQNRHDYDFLSIEKRIQKIVDERVLDASNNTANNEPVITNQPKIIERRLKTARKSSDTQPIEAIVHITSPSSSTTASPSSSPLTTKFEQKSEQKNEINHPIVNSNVKEQSSRPKSVLVSSLSKVNQSNGNVNEIKQQRRIRFSDYNIEHEISPSESSDDSDNYDMLPSSSSTVHENKLSLAPIPAKRSVKCESNSDNLNKNIKAFVHENDNYSMDQVLESIKHYSDDYSVDKQFVGSYSGLRSANQTKVQELAEVIEAKLNKRNIDNKKPPIGSVNVMSTDSKSYQISSDELLYDSDY